MNYSEPYGNIQGENKKVNGGFCSIQGTLHFGLGHCTCWIELNLNSNELVKVELEFEFEIQFNFGENLSNSIQQFDLI